MTAPSGFPPLQYAPKPPVSNRSRRIRWGIAAAILIAYLTLHGWPQRVVNFYRLRLIQHQCMQHPIPPGTVVYSSGPPLVAIASPPVAAIYSVSSLTSIRWAAGQQRCTLFVGALRAPNGTRRFVTVEAGVIWKPGREAKINFGCTCSGLGLTDYLRCNGGEASFIWGIASPPPVPEIAIRSATVDPSDPSHISFTCQLFGRSEIWNGYLHDDGNFVLESR